MTFYSKLTADQVKATYALITFLERLKAIGHLEIHTERSMEGEGGDIFGEYVLHDFTGADYSLVKDKYTNDRGHIDAIILLEKLFGKLHPH